MSLGQRKVLEEEDLYEPVPNERTKFITDKLEMYILKSKYFQVLCDV